MNHWKFVPSVSLMALAAVHATGAYAQSNSPEQAGDDSGVAEIVITAQKRAESLSRTAAAVSVVGQETLDSIGADNFNDAVSTIPNVSASGLGGTVAIRGLGTNTLGAGNGTVAFHVNGIFQAGGGQRLYDIERVEVLRGPQGTLYGRNATAGVVNIITSKANTERVEAFGDVSYSSWNTLGLRGVVNVPLAEGFAVRLTGTYENSNDWKVLADGSHPDKADALSLRLSWRARPSDVLTWDASLSYDRDNGVSVAAVPNYYYDADTATFIRASNPRNLASFPVGAENDGLPFLGLPFIPSVYQGVSFEEANTRKARNIAFRSNVNIELSDALSLNYLLGYSKGKNLPGMISGLVAYQVAYSFPSKSTSWSHEVNLNYDSERLKAILGVYSFQTTSSSGDQMTRVFKESIDPVTNFIDYDVPLIDVGAGPGGGTNRTRAIFGQATFDVTEQFRVTGGARYNWDRTSYDASYSSFCPFGSGVNGQQPNVSPTGPVLGAIFGPAVGALPLCTAAQSGIFAAFDPQFAAPFFYVRRDTPGGSKRFTKFSWKGTVEYDLAPTTMFYATVATGYKAGGAGDTQAVGDDRFFRPETNINYEAGIRSRLFNNKLSLNLTGFWTDYKDLQIETTNPSQPGDLIQTNAGKSRSRGIELEYAWAPTRADRINGYIAYLDAKFTDFPGIDNLTDIPGNFKGNRLPGAPKFSGRISYSHVFDLGSAGTITPTASIYYQSKTFVSYTNTLPSKVGAYTRSDFIIRYETANERFSVEAFVNNIEDKLVLNQVFPAKPVSAAYYSEPRSYGVRVGFRY